jgi:N-acetylneuraminate lyase
MNKFSGAWPALLTPHDADGGVNVPVLEELVEYLLDQQVDGLYLCGTTGEGIYMPVADRQRVTDTVVEQVQGRVPVITHIGCVATQDAITLARHARAASVDGISSIIPPFYRSGPAALAYFSAIGEAVPELPLLPYIIGLPMDATALMRELLSIPSVAGTKYTGPNMYEFREILQMGDASRPHGWTVFSGMDEQCVFAAMFGAHGNIGSTLNFIPGPYKAIHACVRSGDLVRAKEWQLRANRITGIALSFGFPGAMCEIMRTLGLDCGEPLLPNLPLPADQRTELRGELESAGFSELARGAVEAA